MSQVLQFFTVATPISAECGHNPNHHIPANFCFPQSMIWSNFRKKKVNVDVGISVAISMNFTNSNDFKLTSFIGLVTFFTTKNRKGKTNIWFN